jgi:MFS family permease
VKPVRSVISHRYYVVFLLSAIYMCSFADRIVMSLIIDPVRIDLGLSDTQMSLLMGLAFAMFYSFLGIPIGRWVDEKGQRRVLIAGGVVLWCLATIGCGMAVGFWSLFAARMLIGAGEATVVPATYSLIPDLFGKDEIGFAMSIFYAGASVGAGLAMFFGGWVVDWTPSGLLGDLLGGLEPWRRSFIIIGAPGLILAFLMLATVREPRRSPVAAKNPASAIPYLRNHAPLYACLFLGMAPMVVITYSLTFWGPAYLMRAFNVAPSAASTVFGVALGVFGTAGMLLGGLISDFLTRRGRKDGPLITLVCSVLLAAASLIFSFTTDSLWLAQIGIWTGATLIFMQGGPQAALLRMVTPSALLGQVSAFYVAINNLIAIGLAPVLTAAASDGLFEGPRAIGGGLALTIAVAAPLSASLLCLAHRRYMRKVVDLSSGLEVKAFPASSPEVEAGAEARLG